MSNSLRASVKLPFCVLLRKASTKNSPFSSEWNHLLGIHLRMCSTEMSRPCYAGVRINGRLRLVNKFDRDVHFSQINCIRTISVTARRDFHFEGRCLRDKDSSKVESTVKALKEKQEKDSAAAAAKSPDIKAVQTEPAKDVIVVVPKRSLGKRIVDEIRHYYHGFRLLFIDTKIAARLTWKAISGNDLTRREYRQLTRTAADIFRLVPFSVFIIVPFMEFLLPVFIKFFPGMLPSTFESTKDKETKIKVQLKVKLEMTKFLQTTLDEMALQAKGETHSNSAKEFADFFEKIRKTGADVKNEDILKFSKLFEDEITLDSLSRPQLTALCRLLELKPIGPDRLLRFQLTQGLRRLRADDKMLVSEGIPSLTVPELQQACRARGMRALGVPEDRLRTQLEQWLELSLNGKIPPSLLLLSRILYLPENVNTADQLKATLQSLPLDAATEAKYKIGETEGKIDNKTKLELIKKEEAAIKKETEDAEREKKAKEVQKKPPVVDVGETIVDSADVILDKAIAVKESMVEAVKVKIDEQEKELSREDLQSLEDALEHIENEKKSLVMEKEELQDIKEEMDDYREDIEQFRETGNKELRESKAAKNLRKKVESMVTNMDKVLGGLESKKEVKVLQDTIGDMIKGYGNDDDDKSGEKVNQEQLVNINDLILVLRKVGDEEKVKKIEDVLDLLDVDHDGNVEIELVMKVIDLLSREDVNVSNEQVQDLVKLFHEEEKIEEDEKKKKLAENGAKKADSPPRT